MKDQFDDLVAKSVRGLPAVSFTRKESGKGFSLKISPPEPKVWNKIICAIRANLDGSPFKLQSEGDCSAVFVPKPAKAGDTSSNSKHTSA